MPTPFDFEFEEMHPLSFTQWVKESPTTTLEELVKDIEELKIPRTYPDGKMGTDLRMQAAQLYAQSYTKTTHTKERALIIADYYQQHLNAFAEYLYEQAQRQKMGQIKGVLEI